MYVSGIVIFVFSMILVEGLILKKGEKGREEADSDCSVLPDSMNGKKFKKGCEGAVWSNGKPSKKYCLGASGRFPWWKVCCKWKSNRCTEIGCQNNIDTSTCAAWKNLGYCTNSNHVKEHCQATCGLCGTCYDGFRNQKETGVDCGGPCRPCGCKNKANESKCAMLKKSGGCTNDYIKKICLRTCGGNC